ncbi:MAG: CAP domain-containing protein [Planctomycetota bacterium]
MQRFWLWFVLCWGMMLSSLLAQAFDFKAPVDYLKPLEKASRKLAEKGRDHEALEVLAILRDLGYPEENHAELLDHLKGKLARKKKPAAKVADAAREISLAAKRLGTLLRNLDEADQESLARLILRLDDQVAEARAVMEENAIPAERDPEEAGNGEEAPISRRAAMAQALQQARRLEVPIQISDSEHPMILDVYGKPGVKVQSGYLEVHTILNREKAARIVRETMRALALSSFLLRGNLEVPRGLKSQWVLMDSRVTYVQAVNRALMREGLDANEAENARQVTSFLDRRGFGVFFDFLEARVEARLFTFLEPYTRFAQPCLRSGHLNWVCLAHLGISLPDVGWLETEKGEQIVKTDRRVYAPEENKPELAQAELERIRRVNAGLAGCRQWIIHLVERGEDPSWSFAMLDAMGKIRDDALLKTTMVVEYLLEQEQFLLLMYETEPHLPRNMGRPPAEVIEGALGMPLNRFEARWREWILPDKPCLAKRVTKPMDLPLSREEKKVLARVNEARKWALGQAMLPSDYKESSRFLRGMNLESADYRKRYTVSLDHTLSRGAALHARYLTQNPEQLGKWPDIHEEYADRKGFTVEGAWAATHSLIATDAPTEEEAIQGWLDGFYHRLPLLDPGLIGIGWGYENGVAVLDAGSLVAAFQEPWIICWPYKGMRKVPPRYKTELPLPVAVDDPASLGYPITLQVYKQILRLEVRMTLHETKNMNEVVECYFISPSNPLNAEHIPESAFCLIPKQPLESRTSYTVKAWINGEEKPVTWNFETGF